MPADHLRELSMGMSHDFEVAIDEGRDHRPGRHGDLRPAAATGCMTSSLRLSTTSRGVRVDLRVIPRAPKTALDGVRDGRLLVRVTAPPVDRAANDAVVAALATALRVPRRNISIVAGDTGRNKTVEIAGLAASDLLARLSAILTD